MRCSMTPVAAKLLIVLLTAALLAGCQATVAQVKNAFQPELHPDLSEPDARLAARTLQTALEGQPDAEAVAWRSPTSGWSGAFTPLRTFQTETGTFCREFQEDLAAPADRSARYRLTACRTGRGVWIVQ
jgi:surface antigen